VNRVDQAKGTVEASAFRNAAVKPTSHARRKSYEELRQSVPQDADLRSTARRRFHQETFLIRIILLLILGATAAAAWASQLNGGGEEVRTIEVIASRFKFEPSIISVAQGDRIQLRLRSADRDHRFAIKAFRVKALIPKTGEAVTVAFVADRTGTFEFTCDEYCGTGHSGMKGRLVVLARDK
jgi:cytochrome c oxidase subunit 2